MQRTGGSYNAKWCRRAGPARYTDSGPKGKPCVFAGGNACHGNGAGLGLAQFMEVRSEMTMTVLPISLTLAAVAALINIWLMIRVGRVRTREQVMVGDGGNDAVIRRMRAHSNYIESTAFVMLLIILVELASGTQLWLWIVGGVYFLGRIAHAIGMDGATSFRFVGTLTTLLVQAALAIVAILTVYLTPVAVTTPVIEAPAAATSQ